MPVSVECRDCQVSLLFWNIGQNLYVSKILCMKNHFYWENEGESPSRCLFFKASDLGKWMQYGDVAAREKIMYINCFSLCTPE